MTMMIIILCIMLFLLLHNDARWLTDEVKNLKCDQLYWDDCYCVTGVKGKHNQQITAAFLVIGFLDGSFCIGAIPLPNCTGARFTKKILGQT